MRVAPGHHNNNSLMVRKSCSHDFSSENSKEGQKVHEIEIFDDLSTDLRTPFPEDNLRRECRQLLTFEEPERDSYIPENMEKRTDFIFQGCSSRLITQDREEITRIKKPKITHCEEHTIDCRPVEHNNDHQNEMLERCGPGLIHRLLLQILQRILVKRKNVKET